jgi:hypothetical protein
VSKADLADVEITSAEQDMEIVAFVPPALASG